jgi:hypothetical protein
MGYFASLPNQAVCRMLMRRCTALAPDYWEGIIP